MVLTDEQKLFFEKNGYVGPFTLFSPQQAKDYKNMIARSSLQKKPYPFHKHKTKFNCSPTRCEDPHYYNRNFYKLATSNEILTKVTSLRGRDIILLRTVFLNKPPNSYIVPWHKDIHQGLFIENPTFISIVSCWLALEDVDESNGCLEFISGSHEENLTSPEIYACEDFIKQSLMSPTLLAPKQVNISRVAKLPMRAGEFVLFDQRILHASGPNSSAKSRCAFVMRYAPININTKLKVKCMLVCGHDRGYKQRIISPPRNYFQCLWRKHSSKIFDKK